MNSSNAFYFQTNILEMPQFFLAKSSDLNLFKIKSLYVKAQNLITFWVNLTLLNLKH